MSPTDIARLLLDALDAPRGAVSIAAVPDAVNGYVLRVWVRSDTKLPNVPSSFLGYPVRVESRPQLVADFSI